MKQNDQIEADNEKMQSKETIEEIELLSDHKLDQMLRKARRKSLFRTSTISLIIASLLLATIASFFLLHKREWSSQLSYELHNQISGPNVLVADRIFYDWVFKGTSEIQTYKLLKGVPVPWERIVVESNWYTWWREEEPMLGSSTVQIVNPETNQINHYHPKSLKKVLQFYYPKIKYPVMKNELNQLDKISSNKYVELGISFDRSYSFEEIQHILPKDVELAWCWVDTYQYTDESIKGHEQSMQDFAKTHGLRADFSNSATNDVYGFQVSDPEGRKRNEQTFIKDLETLKNYNKGYIRYQQDAEMVYNALRGNKTKVTKEDIRIIGAVVVGTPNQLKQLQNQKFVRAAVIGATVDPH